MHITRRNFLQSLTASATLVASGGLTVFGQRKKVELTPLPAETYSNSFYSLTAKEFAELKGTEFIVTSVDGQRFSLVLTEVNPIEHQQNTLRGYYGECFSLIFEGKQEPLFTQGVYEVAGGGLEMSLALIVPTGRQQKQYEIIINHLTR